MDPTRKCRSGETRNVDLRLCSRRLCAAFDVGKEGETEEGGKEEVRGLKKVD